MHDGCSDEEKDDDPYKVTVRNVVEHFDYLFKIILLGDSGVGKSCILTRFEDGDLSQKMVEITGGIVFKHLVFNVDNKVVKLQVWDSAGQQRFRCVTKVHCRKKDAFLICYDVTDRISFEHAIGWINEVIKCTEKAILFLIANKCDYESMREVSRTEGEQVASDYKLPYLETSAVSGLNVELMFEAMSRTLIARASGNEPYNSIFV